MLQTHLQTHILKATVLVRLAAGMRSGTRGGWQSLEPSVLFCMQPVSPEFLLGCLYKVRARCRLMWELADWERQGCPSHSRRGMVVQHRHSYSSLG